MGSDKASLIFEGQRLVDRVADRLSEVAEPVMFATGTIGRLGQLPGREITDMRGVDGPLAGVLAGAEASPHDLLAVVAVDMPWLNPDLLALLAELWEGEDAVVPVDPDGPQVLHAVYSKSLLRYAQRAVGSGKGLRAFLEQCEVRYVEAALWGPVDPQGRFAKDVDRPEDLAHLDGFTS